MIPAKSLYDNIPTLVAADGDIGIGALMKVIIAPFTPSVFTVAADLTFGANDLAPLATAANPTVAKNALTGQWQISFPGPIGGFRWVLNGVTPTLPVTIYGFALTDSDAGAVQAVYALPTPIVVSTPDTVLAFDEAFLLMLVPPMV